MAEYREQDVELVEGCCKEVRKVWCQGTRECSVDDVESLAHHRLENANRKGFLSYLDNLDPDSKCIPVGNILNVALGIDAEQYAERVEPNRKNRGSSFFDRLGMRILHHVKTLNTLPENRYRSCPCQRRVALGYG